MAEDRHDGWWVVVDGGETTETRDVRRDLRYKNRPFARRNFSVAIFLALFFLLIRFLRVLYGLTVRV